MHGCSHTASVQCKKGGMLQAKERVSSASGIGLTAQARAVFRTQQNKDNEVERWGGGERGGGFTVVCISPLLLVKGCIAVLVTQKCSHESSISQKLLCLRLQGVQILMLESHKHLYDMHVHTHACNQNARVRACIRTPLPVQLPHSFNQDLPSDVHITHIERSNMHMNEWRGYNIKPWDASDHLT
jgi:hypothetical protein